jgi:hypothetical protein
MHTSRRLATLAATVALCAAVPSLTAATPASASAQSDATSAITQQRAATQAGCGNYWCYYYTYFSLEDCQAKGAELGDGIAVDYYCNQIYRSGYSMWELWYGPAD